MSTLISFHSSSGAGGRCDAKCYNAEHEKCDCICGGKNHGAGLDQAVKNTNELAEKWIEDFKKIPGNEDLKFEINPQNKQLKLF